LLAAALEAFAERGLDATPASIAKQAGVGVGTLYRHFPTREALIDAAYRSELERLCASASDIRASTPAACALRAWMDKFLTYATTKRGMAGALATVISAGGDPYGYSRELLTTAIASLLEAGSQDGTLRPDLNPDDVLLSISGMVQSTGDFGTREQASRLFDLLMNAFTPRVAT